MMKMSINDGIFKSVVLCSLDFEAGLFFLSFPMEIMLSGGDTFIFIYVFYSTVSWSIGMEVV